MQFHFYEIYYMVDKYFYLYESNVFRDFVERWKNKNQLIFGTNY